MKEFEHPSAKYTIKNIKPEDAGEIYTVLEEPNWAPWLAATKDTIAKRAQVFPKGQLVMRDNNVVVASLCMNKISWSGLLEELPTWDQVAGDPTDFSKTYIEDGNTLVLLSMNVDINHRGMHLPSKMIDAAADIAGDLGVEYLIGSFRPSGYGKAKKNYDYKLDFWKYCQMTRQGSSKPVDPWLGSLWHKGVKLLISDDKAMFVSTSLNTWMQYKDTYKPELWNPVDSLIWECEEVGTWHIDPDQEMAYYVESNAWGSLPLIYKK